MIDEEKIPEPYEHDVGQDSAQQVLGIMSELAIAPYSAAEAAIRAELDDYNDPGYCLQQVRIWAGIPALHRTAAIAWMYATDKRYDPSKARRGAFHFWTGGSNGYGHVAMELGGTTGGLNIRSTDAGGSGRVATRSLEWFNNNWPSMHYAGWTNNLNGYTVSGVLGDEFDMAELSDLRNIVREEIRDPGFIEKIGDEVWRREFSATNANDVAVKKPAREFLTTTWETVKRLGK